jgi:flagellin-specific chaperone FliS
MPSNPYMKASGAYRSATQTLPPVRGVAALLERCQSHCAAAVRHADARQYQEYAGDIQSAINILTGLSLYLGNYLDKPTAAAWQDMTGNLIIALGRAAAGRNAPRRVRICHDQIAQLRQIWSHQAGLERAADEPVYTGHRPKTMLGAVHG